MPLFVHLHPLDLDDDQLLSPDAPLSRVASRIVLEITEWTSLAPTPRVQRRLRALRELGYRLAVDDLGMGYSELATVANIGPDIVKLDMSITRRVNEEPAKRRVVESAITRCRELGSLAAAEGVESLGERDTLTELGCDFMQGHLFARPGRGFHPVMWGT